MRFISQLFAFLGVIVVVWALVKFLDGMLDFATQLRDAIQLAQ